MVEESITACYDRELERLEQGERGEFCYRPLDTGYARELSVALWGELLTPQAIEDIFARLEGQPWFIGGQKG